MASKRAFAASIPCIARLSSPAARNLLQPRRQLPVSLPSTTARLITIPRPRNPSPFTNPSEQTTTTTTASPPQSSPTTPIASTSTATAATTDQPSSQAAQKPPPNVTQQPHYELTFTCRPCSTRSRHRVSKQGYHHGSVLIACPSCRNRHVISDHLRIFGDKAQTIEDILRDKGELIKRGTLGAEEDMEFWEDGTTTPREEVTAWAGGSGLGEEEGVVDENALPGASFKSVKPGEGK